MVGWRWLFLKWSSSVFEVNQQRDAYSKGGHHYRASTTWWCLGAGKGFAGKVPCFLNCLMYFTYIAQIDNEGRQIPVIASPYIWLDPSLLGDISNVPSSDLLPCVCTPLSQSSLSVCRLISLCKVALRHNFFSALLTIGGGLMALHYRKIVEVGHSRTIMLLCDNNLFVAVVFWMSHSGVQWPSRNRKVNFY